MNSEQMERKLRIIQVFNKLPEWAKIAYYQDSLVNRIIDHHVHAGSDESTMVWDLCKHQYEDRTRFLAEIIQMHAASMHSKFVILDK